MKPYGRKIGFSFLCLLYSFASAKLTIECERDNIVIKLPLDNENIANILELQAGNCTHENIPNGVENAISYFNGSAIIQIPSEECGLKEIYEEPKLRVAGEFYMPTVNFTLGVLPYISYFPFIIIMLTIT